MRLQLLPIEVILSNILKPGLKMGTNLRGHVWIRVLENCIFWSEIASGFKEPSRPSTSKIPGCYLAVSNISGIQGT